MIDVVSAVCSAVSAVVILVCVAREPAQATCPPGWWLPEGVRPHSGLYVCKPKAPVCDGTGPRGGYFDCSEQPPGWLVGRVYCPVGKRAVTVDGVVITCAL